MKQPDQREAEAAAADPWMTPERISLRNLAMSTDLDDISNTVIKSVNDRPLRISDVADVLWDIEPMRGDAAINGSPGVILSVTKAPGFDTLELTGKIKEELRKIRNMMPQGVEIEPLFQQADFIGNAIGNLEEAIRDGALEEKAKLLVAARRETEQMIEEARKKLGVETTEAKKRLEADIDVLAARLSKTLLQE